MNTLSATRPPGSRTILAPTGSLLLSLALVAAPPLAAQDEPADTLFGWRGEAEVGVSIFFGNTDQKVANARGEVSRTDSTTQIDGALRYSYGKATDPEGEPFLIKRFWLAESTLEYRPFNAVSPFALASAESSFEKRIDLRYAAGAGARVNAVTTPQTSVEGSLALLGERTEFDEAAEVDEEEELLRWAAQLRMERTLAGGDVEFRSETTYRPKVDALARFTLSSATSLSYALSDNLSAKVSFIDDYDSRAEARGAESNNDGQIVFGVLSTF